MEVIIYHLKHDLIEVNFSVPRAGTFALSLLHLNKSGVRALHRGSVEAGEEGPVQNSLALRVDERLPLSCCLLRSQPANLRGGKTLWELTSCTSTARPGGAGRRGGLR